VLGFNEAADPAKEFGAHSFFIIFRGQALDRGGQFGDVSLGANNR
jgi:hypothetical protein